MGLHEEMPGTQPVVKVIDLGLARLITEGGKIAHMKAKCGTRGYMAPEITRHNECGPIAVTPAIDMWALGMVLCEMAVGYNPSLVFTAKMCRATDVNPIVFSHE